MKQNDECPFPLPSVSNSFSSSPLHSLPLRMIEYETGMGLLLLAPRVSFSSPIHTPHMHVGALKHGVLDHSSFPSFLSDQTQSHGVFPHVNVNFTTLG